MPFKKKNFVSFFAKIYVLYKLKNIFESASRQYIYRTTRSPRLLRLITPIFFRCYIKLPTSYHHGFEGTIDQFGPI